MIMASGPITSWLIDWETVDTVTDFILRGSKITSVGDCSHESKRRLLLERKVITKLDSILKSKVITVPTNVHLAKGMVFPVFMYGCESWTIKKADHQTIDAFELWCWRRLLSLLDCKEIQLVNPKENRSWILIGRTDAETPILWPPDVKNWLIGKDPDGGKDCRLQEKGKTEDKMVGWHHGLDGHEFVYSPDVGDGREAWQGKAHGVTKFRTQLSDWNKLLYIYTHTFREPYEIYYHM